MMRSAYEEKRLAEIDIIARQLINNTGSFGHNPTFVARDLGFADHTAIHAAVRVILAEWAAKLIWDERNRDK